MKKRWYFLVLTLVLILTLTSISFASEEQDIKVWVNGKYVLSDVEPFIHKDRTLVPIRFIAQELGYEVSWDNDVRRVIVEEGDIRLELFIDSNIMYRNGEEILIDTEPIIKQDRTYVPLRFIGQAMNVKIDYCHSEKVAIVGDGFKENQAYPVRTYKQEDFQNTDYKVNYKDRMVYYYGEPLSQFDTDGQIRATILNNVYGPGTVDTPLNVYLDGRLIYTIDDPMYREHELMFPAFKTARAMYGLPIFGEVGYGNGGIDDFGETKEYFFSFPENEYIYNTYSKELYHEYGHLGHVDYKIEPMTTEDELYLDFDTYLYCFSLRGQYDELDNNYYLKRENFLDPFGNNPYSEVSFKFNPEAVIPPTNEDPFYIEGEYEGQIVDSTTDEYIELNAYIDYFGYLDAAGNHQYDIILELHPNQGSSVVVLGLVATYDPLTGILDSHESSHLIYSGGEPMILEWYQPASTYQETEEGFVDINDQNIYLNKVNSIE